MVDAAPSVQPPLDSGPAMEDAALSAQLDAWAHARRTEDWQTAARLRAQLAAAGINAERERPLSNVLPCTPKKISCGNDLVDAGGLEAYLNTIRHWWYHPANDFEKQDSKRTTVLVELVRTLALSNDHDLASTVPHGLRRAMGRTVGDATAKRVRRPPLIRRDSASLEMLNEVLEGALTARLSAERRDGLCDRLLVSAKPLVPTSSGAADDSGHAAAQSVAQAGDDRGVIGVEEIMSTLLAHVSDRCRAKHVRASAAAAVVDEFSDGVPASTLLSLRCLVLYAFVHVPDAAGTRAWSRTMHRDWIPPGLLQGVDGVLAEADPASTEAIDGGVEADARGVSDMSQSLVGGGLTALPAPLIEAGRLALSGWGSKHYDRIKGRHGAVLVRPDGEAIGRGCNAAEGPAVTGKRGAAGGVKGKFVVHAEMVAVREALEACGGDLGAVCGACIYVSRLAPRGEHFEDGAPCARCESVLRACGLGKALWTTTEGVVGSISFAEADATPTVLDDEHCKWMGVPTGWMARRK